MAGKKLSRAARKELLTAFRGRYVRATKSDKCAMGTRIGHRCTNFEGTSQSRAACSPIRARTAAMELLKVRRRRRHKALWSRNSPKHGT